MASPQPVDSFLRGILELGRRVRAERPPGSLSLSGLGILGTLHRHGPLVATELAVRERLQPQSLTRLVADLAREGLVTRTRSDVDRRAFRISVTEKGRQMLKNDMAARRSWLESAMAGALTPPEADVVERAGAVMLKLASYEPRITNDER